MDTSKFPAGGAKANGVALVDGSLVPQGHAEVCRRYRRHESLQSAEVVVNDDICKFIDAAARTLAIFREAAAVLREGRRFENVTTALIPWTDTNPFTELKTTSLNFSVDADLLRWTDINKKAVSACIVICCTEGRWRLECEYGWSGQEIGFDQVEDETIEYDTADSLVEDLEGRSIALLRSFEAFVADC